MSRPKPVWLVNSALQHRQHMLEMIRSAPDGPLRPLSDITPRPKATEVLMESAVRAGSVRLARTQYGMRSYT